MNSLHLKIWIWSLWTQVLWYSSTMSTIESAINALSRVKDGTGGMQSSLGVLVPGPGLGQCPSPVRGRGFMSLNKVQTGEMLEPVRGKECQGIKDLDEAKVKEMQIEGICNNSI